MLSIQTTPLDQPRPKAQTLQKTKQIKPKHTKNRNTLSHWVTRPTKNVRWMCVCVLCWLFFFYDLDYFLIHLSRSWYIYLFPCGQQSPNPTWIESSTDLWPGGGLQLSARWPLRCVAASCSLFVSCSGHPPLGESAVQLLLQLEAQVLHASGEKSRRRSTVVSHWATHKHLQLFGVQFWATPFKERCSCHIVAVYSGCVVVVYYLSWKLGSGFGPRFAQAAAEESTPNSWSRFGCRPS